MSDFPMGGIDGIDYSTVWNAPGIDIWNNPDIGIDWGTTYPEIMPDWGVDWNVGGGTTGGTTGGNTGFWNQAVGGLGQAGGLFVDKAFDLGLAGVKGGIGMSAMNKAQQAAQVQAERAALAQMRSDIWSAGLQRLSDDTEYARQKDAKLFNIAHLNDPNVIQDQKRNMLLNAGRDRVDPQIAAHYFLTS